MVASWATGIKVIVGLLENSGLGRHMDKIKMRQWLNIKQLFLK